MIDDLTTNSYPEYDFLEPIDLKGAAGQDRLFSELVATEAFQRLHSIRFLGGIDYLLVRSPNGHSGNVRYTRYQHSLGVARLAIFYCHAIALPVAVRRLVYSAALLHDIGHAPLSHSLEPVFKELFGLTHHQATEDVITGRAPLGVEVYNTLRIHNVDVERVLAIIAGEETDYHGFFSGPINFDTIEGILRARAYITPRLNGLRPEVVIEAAINRTTEHDCSVVDDFWTFKDQVYCHIINSRNGMLADFACQDFMRHHLNAVSEDDYFVTEKQIFKKLPGLRDLLTSHQFESKIMKNLNRPIHYVKRRFFIDKSVDFYLRDDKCRYRQSKEERILYPSGSYKKEAVGLTRNMFDDNSD